MSDNQIDIYTDGACKGNPGVGGWGALLRYEDKEKEINGFSSSTTNNIMELTAVIEALKQIKKPYMINITTDSTYVKNGITEWIHNWKTNGWKTAAKKSVKNKELLLGTWHGIYLFEHRLNSQQRTIIHHFIGEI